MIEVHPPDHSIHSVRDFMIHLLTITVGLLIALGLENIAEYAHHRHLVHEADTNLRHELDDNRKDLKAVLESVPKEQATFKELLAFLQAHAAGEKADLQKATVGVVMMTPQDASWQTANATGALSFMEYNHVQHFAAAYQLQKKLDTVQDGVLPPLTILLATFSTGDPTRMSKDEANIAVTRTREVMARLEIVRELGVDLDRKYADVLTEK